MRIAFVAAVLSIYLGGCDSSEGGVVDENQACTPVSIRKSCVPDVLAGYRRCSVQEGECSWSAGDAGAADQSFVAQWSGGARIEGEVENGLLSVARLHGPRGEQCTTTLLQGERCEGQRFEADGRWFQYCIQLDSTGFVESYRYTCDDGQQYTVDVDELRRANANDDCMPPSTRLLACVDDRGRTFEEGFDFDPDADAGI